ncbi:MAG: hypothetical protein LBL59_12110 [Xanthomonadaceae bacterium]|jgi:hypothetical protein|nr:hypothetical protein [Xanthomonadaceae bacterium]
MSDTEARFNDSNLYDASGRPRPEDVGQDLLGDCYLLATMAALAAQQPERLQDAVRYDARTQTFRVTLFESAGILGNRSRPVEVEVTQQELDYNLQRKGGSRVDNCLNEGGSNCYDLPVWPAVIETAYAKRLAQVRSDGLEQGFDRMGNGDWPSTAMHALTGDYGETLKRNAVGRMSEEQVSARLEQALQAGRPVTLYTQAERGALQDGLMDNHAYMLTGIAHTPEGELTLHLRNPWGNNLRISEGRGTPDAVIDVELKTLLQSQSLGAINIGPTPRVQEQVQEERHVWRSGDPELDRLLAAAANPAALKQAMQALAESPTGQAYFEEGRHAYQEQQEQISQQQASIQRQEAPQETMHAPVLRR